MKFIDGGVTAAKGFLASGIHCGIRKNKTKRDLSLIYSDTICTAAAVYTQNLVKGAPLLVTKKHIENGTAQAVICNSGNANTCNANGIEIAEKMCDILAKSLPVKAEDISEHHMHAELCMISQETAEILNKTKAEGGRIICVGTTSCRTIESVAREDGTIPAMSGDTGIFIYPGYRFKAVDALITNFHLPESTLIMLVSALAGREETLAAYEEAVKERYRFFSFGDAMFIK